MPSVYDKRIEELFARFGRGVGRYVLARLGDEELAEEITARVFLKVVRSLHQCRTSPAAWLWAVVRSELSRHWRERRHQPVHDGLVSGADPPAARAERDEAVARLSRAMKRLGEPQQTLVYMKFFQQMGNTEIAEAAGLSVSNVGVLLHRAIKQLREMMEP